MVSDVPMRWAVLLVSQTVKITVLAVLFTTVIMAVNNSCKNKVKGRVNGASTAAAAFGRIVSPVVHGVIFSWSLRQHVAIHQFVVFGFVAACSLVLFLLVSALPKTLDAPPREDDVAAEDDQEMFISDADEDEDENGRLSGGAYEARTTNATTTTATGVGRPVGF